MSELLRSIREQLAYTIWADRTLLEALRHVDQPDLERQAGLAFGSLLGTMVHILEAEQIWLARFLGAAATPELTSEQFPDRLRLAMAFEELWSQLEFFVASLSEEQVASHLTWTSRQGQELTRLFRHAVFHFVCHAIHHRGQVSSLLRQLGYVPPDIDFLTFSGGS